MTLRRGDIVSCEAMQAPHEVHAECIAPALDPIAVDCDSCRAFSPLAICQDDECGCSVCEGFRAERAERKGVRA
jgi:hypothetical protein